jgi:hypothetical protein
VTSVPDQATGDRHEVAFEKLLRPQRPTARFLLNDAAGEWRRLREGDVPIWEALVFVALRIVQRYSYHQGWEEGASRADLSGRAPEPMIGAEPSKFQTGGNVGE